MIRIAVCDDERCFVEQMNHIITNHARDISQPPETSFYTSSSQLLYDVEEGAHFDLLLLDIEMPEGDGMSLATHNMQLRRMSCLFSVTSQRRRWKPVCPWPLRMPSRF